MIYLEMGDKFKSLLTDKVFEVKSFTDWMVLLESEDKLSQVLTEKVNLNLFYQKVTDEEPEVPKGFGHRET